MKYMLLLLTAFVVTSCTLNFGITDTHGTSENVDNDDLKTDAEAQATIPISPL